MLAYLKAHKWRLLSGSVLAGGVYYYFRDYIEIVLSLAELANKTESPKTRSERAEIRFAEILTNSDQISFSLPRPAAARLAELQTKLRDKQAENREANFRDFVRISLAQSLALITARVFARQFVRVAAVLASETGGLQFVLEDLNRGLDEKCMHALFSCMHAQVEELVEDPTREISTSELQQLLETLAAAAFSVSHRLVEPQPQDGRLHAALASAMIDTRWRATYAQRLLGEFARIAQVATGLGHEFPIARVLGLVRELEVSAATTWTSDALEAALFDWSRASDAENDAGAKAEAKEGEDAELLAMMERLARRM